MPPEARSITTSSKSATNRVEGPDTSIQFVKGVGPRLGAIFKSRGIETVKDLLLFFPRAYEDRTRFSTIAELAEGVKATVSVRVVGSRKIPTRSYGRSIMEVRCTDDAGGNLSLKWFHVPRGMENRFTVGAQLLATGTVKRYLGKPEMVHPEISWGAVSIETIGPNVGRVVPVYTEIEGVTTRVLRKILWEAVEKFSATLTEDLPEQYLSAHGLPAISQSVRAIHFPPDGQGITIENLVRFNTPAHWRLVYEEFFKFEYLVLRQRLRMQKESAPAIGVKGGREAAKTLEQSLPFRLTQGQQQALKEIFTEIGEPHPMNRLVQGDVGSGKTAVAFLAAGCALAEGFQAVLMAPTEILAEQHYKTAVKLFGGRLNVALLTGKTTTAERNKLLPRLAAGEPVLLLGTHALLEDPVIFKSLSLVMIDEQHRFGVEQRRTLRHKGTRTDSGGRALYPHILVLSATPIPRTLALTAYGDLSVSTIRELPPGRSPVITRVVAERAERARAYEHIRDQLKAGRQAYFIYPLVNESEAEGFTELKSAVAEAERLANEVFPEFRVGILHGQLKPEDKAAVMTRFQRGEIHLLVATTVVEVGVDVPNATIIAVEHSERFGLSQLHQLRGRVGRGDQQSYCFLFTASRPGETAEQRLRVLQETNDGFRIAEADLEIRGPGEFLGTRQAGDLPFKIAHLIRDREWLLKARDDAAELLSKDAELERTENLRLRRFFEREGKLQFDRLRTS